MGKRGEYSKGQSIPEITDDLIGKRVWFVDPREGIRSIVVTSIYHTVGRGHKSRYGLYYDYKNTRGGNTLTRCLWVKDYRLFYTRLHCEQWLKAVLQKSASDRAIEDVIGFEE